MTRPLGVILAGGQARRMGGGDKCLLNLGGRSLLARVCERLAPQVAGVALNANGDPARFAGHALTVLPDSVTGFAGPLAGVLAGMDWAAGQGVDRIVTVAADTPFFPLDLVARLQAASAGGSLPFSLAATIEIGAEAGGRPVRHPTFGLWPVGLRDDLRAALDRGVRKVVQWTDRHGAGMALFDDPDAFFNVNTPADLARAEAML